MDPKKKIVTLSTSVVNGRIREPTKVAIIFNHFTYNAQLHDNRYGSPNDVTNLRNSLNKYGFDVRIYVDKKAADIQRILNCVAKEDHSARECLMVVAMSHGNKNGQISAFDCFYSVETLWTSFLAESCPSLIGKPKIFIIQACRGIGLETSYQYTDGLNNSLGQSDPYFIPNSADMLIMYACAQGRAAVRDYPDGTWFIQSICQVLNENFDYVNGVDLYYLATAVNKMVAKRTSLLGGKQMSNFVSTLREFYALKRSL